MKNMVFTYPGWIINRRKGFYTCIVDVADYLIKPFIEQVGTWEMDGMKGMNGMGWMGWI